MQSPGSIPVGLNLWVLILQKRLETNMLKLKFVFFYLLGLGIRFFKRIPNLSGVLNSQFQISDCINWWSWEDKNLLRHRATEGNSEANPGWPKIQKRNTSKPHEHQKKAETNQRQIRIKTEKDQNTRKTNKHAKTRPQTNTICFWNTRSKPVQNTSTSPTKMQFLFFKSTYSHG